MNSKNKTRAREFKLIVEDWRTNALSWSDEIMNDLTTGEIIHVIEYSAYQYLFESNKELVGALEQFKNNESYENWDLLMLVLKETKAKLAALGVKE